MSFVSISVKATQEAETLDSDKTKLKFYKLFTDTLPSDARLRRDGPFSTAWCPFSPQMLYLLHLESFYDCIEFFPSTGFGTTSLYLNFQRIKYMQVINASVHIPIVIFVVDR